MDTTGGQVLSWLEKATRELCEVQMGEGNKNEVAPSWPAKQKEGGMEQEADDVCLLQETSLPSPGIQPGPTPNNSLCDSVMDTAPNYWSEAIKIPDRRAEDIAHAKEVAEEMETFLKTFPSIYVDKTKKTEDQKAAIRLRKMLQVGVLEKEPPSRDWDYICLEKQRREEKKVVMSK